MSSRASGRPADAGPFGSWSSVWTPPWFGDIAWRKEQDDERTAAMDRVAGGVPPDRDGVLECERGVVDAAFIERPDERRHREPEPVVGDTFGYPLGRPGDVHGRQRRDDDARVRGTQDGHAIGVDPDREVRRRRGPDQRGHIGKERRRDRRHGGRKTKTLTLTLQPGHYVFL